MLVMRWQSRLAIYFPKVIPPKLRQPSKTHAHLKAIVAKATRKMEGGRI